MSDAITAICKSCNNDRHRMMDIVRAVQAQCGCVSDAAMEAIAKATGCHRVEVESVVSFYAFLSKEKKGKIVIRLCDDIIDQMQGGDAVGAALSAALGISFGETTADGAITLEHTPCIGMCDQAPAAMVNEVMVTCLNPAKAKQLVADLKAGKTPAALVTTCGDGMNADPRIKAMVRNNIRQAGPVILAGMERGAALKQAAGMSPADIVATVKASGLRGRGGAGFPTGLKWQFAAGAKGKRKAVLCNADEGEPGTFKDRVLLTEHPDAVFEGMTICGKATGADTGLLYLRGEYAYLAAYLNDVLAKRRADGLLGDGFDIRVQLGAGAYICGEESALISSCEGLRGDPKNRPPFPAERGYLDMPTTVNNVETYIAAARIIEKGADWFKALGTTSSAGTKVLSIAGDVAKPGCYEVAFGITLKEVLALAGAKNAVCVCVGGPSGKLVPAKDFSRKFDFDDLATGGSVMVFDATRDVLGIADSFMEFFIEESCGYCTPCRAGNVLMKQRLDNIRAGRGQASDLDYLKELGAVVKMGSRCGLGQTSPNPVLETIANFPQAYQAVLKTNTKGFIPSFDLQDATTIAAGIAGHGTLHDD